MPWFPSTFSATISTFLSTFCRVLCRVFCRVLCRVLNHMFDKMAGNAGSVDEVRKLSTKSRNNCFRSRTQRCNIITKEHEAKHKAVSVCPAAGQDFQNTPCPAVSYF